MNQSGCGSAWLPVGSFYSMFVYWTFWLYDQQLWLSLLKGINRPCFWQSSSLCLSVSLSPSLGCPVFLWPWGQLQEASSSGTPRFPTGSIVAAVERSQAMGEQRSCSWAAATRQELSKMCHSPWLFFPLPSALVSLAFLLVFHLTLLKFLSLCLDYHPSPK